MKQTEQCVVVLSDRLYREVDETAMITEGKKRTAEKGAGDREPKIAKLDERDADGALRPAMPGPACFWQVLATFGKRLPNV